MAVQGVFASDQHIMGNRRPDYTGTLLTVQPEGSAKLLALSSGMESAPAHDTVINWFEDAHIAGRTDILSFVTDGNGTGVNVRDASFYVPGVILLEENTGEYLFVTASDTVLNRITVVRNLQGTGSTIMVVGHFVQRIGTAYEEGSAKPVAIAATGTVRSNFTQIFRNVWSVTGTAKAVEYYTGSIVAKNKAEAGVYHAEDIERSFLWGVKSVGVLNNKPFRTADGITRQLTTNVVAATATTTKADIDAFLMDVFSKNVKGKPNERIVFTGNLGLSIIGQLAELNGVMQLQTGQTSFGMAITKWITPFGTISLMTHPLFTESPYRTGDLLVLHPGVVRTRYLRRTNLDNYDGNGQRDGDDADYGVYTTEMSFEYRAEITGGWFKGMQAAAA